MKQRLNILHSFRGVAAVLVILYHFRSEVFKYFNVQPFDSFTLYGNAGVDILFTVSGFIITYLHLKDVKSTKNPYGFLKKRLIRIIPVYFIVATIRLGLIYSLVYRGRPLGIEGATLNLPFILKSYFLISHDFPPFLRVAWTLQYDLIFYIIFASCILIGYKFAKIVFIAWPLLIIGNYYIVHSPGNIELNYFLSPIFLEFAAGALAAKLCIYRIYKPHNYIVIPIIVSCMVAFYLATLHIPIDRQRVDVALIFALFFGTIFWKSAFVEFDGSVKTPKVLLLIADASYSIYLTHTIILPYITMFLHGVAVRINIVNNAVAFYIIYTMAISITIVLGIIFYYIIERPVLFYINNFKSIKTPGRLKNIILQPTK